ncbi:transcriptional regulator [Alteromonadaceae bacterium 2753L.S.0a.02]|nr:transcriptional regulator [Alteromonadaceae bacterium 2753L.S.0a.02]
MNQPETATPNALQQATFKLHVESLFAFRLRVNDVDLFELSNTKAKLLIVFLLLNRDKQVTRISLARLLWARHDDEQSLNSLRQAINKLKKAFGDNFDKFITVKRKTLAVNTQNVSSDLDWMHHLKYDAAITELLLRELPFQAIEVPSDQNIESWIGQCRLQIYKAAIESYRKFLSEKHLVANANPLAQMNQTLQQLQITYNSLALRLESFVTPGALEEPEFCSSKISELEPPQEYSHKFLLSSGEIDKKSIPYLQAIKEKIMLFWLEGVLFKSQETDIYIGLRFLECTNFIKLPFEATFEGDTSLVNSSKLFDIYCKNKGKILITGEPGSGKTTALLRIINNFQNSGLQDTQSEIAAAPVLLNLSSWKQGQPLDIWVAKELDRLYDIPISISEKLLRNNLLALFLDAFDESNSKIQAELANTINAFIKNHPEVPLTLTSRSAECKKLNLKFSLNRCYQICDLNTKEVLDYSRDIDPEFHSYLASKNLESWQFRSPLSVTIALKTFRTSSDTDQLDTHRQSQLFFNFSLASVPENQRQHQKQGLEKLARYLATTNSSIFQLDELHFDHIQNRFLRMIASILPMAIVAFSIAIITSLTSLAQGGELYRSLTPWPLAVIGLIILTLTGETQKLKLLPKIQFSFDALKRNLKSRLINTIYPALAIGGSCGYIYGLYPGVVTFAMVVFAFSFFLGMDFEHNKIDRRYISAVNKTVVDTRANAVKGLAFGIAIGATCDLLLLNYWFPATGTLMFAAIMFYIFGGLGLIQHYCIRTALFLNRQLPFKLSKLIARGYKYRLLRKVGGGVMFPHKTIQDYLTEVNG